MTRRIGIPFLLIAATFLQPARASADLIGSVELTWYTPDSSTIYKGPESIAVGSALSCPLLDDICPAYGEGGEHTFAIGSDSITYTGANDPTSAYTDNPFNGFVFSGLTFSNGGSLSGFNLSTDIAGLTTADVSFGSSSISVDMAGLPINGTYTLTLDESGGTSAAESSSLPMLGLGVAGLLFCFRVFGPAHSNTNRSSLRL